jgi:23S rRNA (uracil1939-C5)-methyltransferase
MTYDAQLKFKQKSVADALGRMAKIDVSGIMDIVPSPADVITATSWNIPLAINAGYTTAKTAKTSTLNMNALGFHIPGRFDKILDVNHCYLQAEPSNNLRNSIRDFVMEQGYSFYNLRNHEGALRNLIVRTSSTGEVMVIVVFAYTEQEEIDKLMNFIDAGFPEITSLLYIINQKKNDTIFDQDVIAFKGPEYIHEEMNGIKFRIGPKSFYQTNSIQALRLYEITRDFAGFTGNELVYDLYTGAGTIANFIAGMLKKLLV